MSCGFCGIKKRSSQLPRIYAGGLNLSTSDWGPFLWKVLHCFAERVGRSNNINIDRDQGTDFELIITSLWHILPCKICQSHYKSYLTTHRPSWKKLRGDILRKTIVQWLFALHTQVRVYNDQPVQIASIEACSELYSICSISTDELANFYNLLNYASRMRIIKYDELIRWSSIFNRLRLSVGI